MIIELRKGKEIDLRQVMKIHAFVCVLLGLSTLSLPHSFIAKANNGYSHMTHEWLRLYGCLSLSIGWLAWKLQAIRDGRIMRAISEAFAICYVLKAMVMFRAQFTNPLGHSLIHWMIALLFLGLGSLYGHIRFARRIKGFELPGHLDD